MNVSTAFSGSRSTSDAAAASRTLFTSEWSAFTSTQVPADKGFAK
jgi:hypothetical protein